MKILLSILLLGISLIYLSHAQAGEEKDFVRLNDSRTQLSRTSKLNFSLKNNERAKITTSTIQAQDRVIVDSEKTILKLHKEN